jgi:diguanylate cyclase (GGDEF)-like protein
MAALSAIVACLSLALLLKFSDPIVDRLLKDKPTGAFAKRHFDDLLNYEVRRPARHPKGLALMMLDLDRFKAVNDEYGHAFGDRVLASVSEVIRGSIRSDDAFVRCGGDEFAVIMANAAPDGAADAAERVRRAVEAAPVPPGDGRAPVRVTVSVGVASLAPPPRGAKELAGRPDRALYRAKETRNSVVVSQ